MKAGSKQSFEISFCIRNVGRVSTHYKALYPSNRTLRKNRSAALCWSLAASFHYLYLYLYLYTVGKTPWTGSSRRTAAAQTQNTNTERTHTQISIPRLGFEPTTPVFERARTVRALGRAATVIG
jgi:hypothetical protein